MAELSTTSSKMDIIILMKLDIQSMDWSLMIQKLMYHAMKVTFQLIHRELDVYWMVTGTSLLQHVLVIK